MTDPSRTTANTMGFVRNSHTYAALRAPRETSTVDFVFLPRDTKSRRPSQQRTMVPRLPDNDATMSSSMVSSWPPSDETDQATVIRPQIATVAPEWTFEHPPSALSDVVDNAAIWIDPYNLSRSVHRAANKLGGTAATDVAKKETGLVQEIWTGLIDDLFGGPRLKPAP